jgi:hypothetical protein
MTKLNRIGTSACFFMSTFAGQPKIFSAHSPMTEAFRLPVESSKITSALAL